MYPPHDEKFTEQKIAKVESRNGKHTITIEGWCLYCGDDCPIEPKVGQVARQYGAGIGQPVRGLFIDGVKIWYRTESDEKEYQEIQSYGADAEDWLKRWDEGQAVWSIAMGGIGPGYEQCIQIVAAETVRWLLSHKIDVAMWKDRPAIETVVGQMTGESFENPVLKELGLSGAQYGAGRGLGVQIYRDGPRKIMNTTDIKDRHILVSKNFPGSRSAA